MAEHLALPYSDAELDEIAQNIDCEPREGYPACENRLFMWSPGLEIRDNDDVLLPPGYDAVDTTTRPSPEDEKANYVDPEIITGLSYDPETLPYELMQIWRRQRLSVDQYQRPLHPNWRQLLSDSRIGMPTGIGASYYYGEQSVADAVPIRTREDGELEVLLTYRDTTAQSPAVWATPGGYKTWSDEGMDFESWYLERPNSEAGSVETARRKALEETGLAIRALGKVVRTNLPISSPHTINAWTRTHAVAFALERSQDEQAYEDTELETDVTRWFPVSELKGLAMWPDHRRHIAAGVQWYQQEYAPERR